MRAVQSIPPQRPAPLSGHRCPGGDPNACQAKCIRGSSPIDLGCAPRQQCPDVRFADSSLPASNSTLLQISHETQKGGSHKWSFFYKCMIFGFHVHLRARSSFTRSTTPSEQLRMLCGAQRQRYLWQAAWLLLDFWMSSPRKLLQDLGKLGLNPWRLGGFSTLFIHPRADEYTEFLSQQNAYEEWFPTQANLHSPLHPLSSSTFFGCG